MPGKDFLCCPVVIKKRNISAKKEKYLIRPLASWCPLVEICRLLNSHKYSTYGIQEEGEAYAGVSRVRR